MACELRFLDRGRSKRTDHRRAYLHPFRIGEFLQDGFKSRIRLTNALGILNGSFPISEQTRYGKRHRNAMIAEACYARPMQGSWT